MGEVKLTPHPAGIGLKVSKHILCVREIPDLFTVIIDRKH